MKKFKILVVIILLLGLSKIAISQVVNIENKRIYDDTIGFSGNLDLTFSLQKNTNTLFTLQFKPLVQYKTPRHYFLLINDLKYITSNKDLYSNFGMSHFRYAYRLKDKSPWKLEGYTQVQYNQILLQKIRFLIGSGIRFRILNKNKVRLFLGSSHFYEYEEINYSDRPNEYINSTRWSNYFSTYFSFDKFEISTVIYYQPNLFRFKDFRVSGDYNFMVKVTKQLNLKFNLSHYYDSEPPQTIVKNTFSSSLGFLYKIR